MPSKPSVYFVATELGPVHHGPAVYTRALWELFRDSPLFDFHLVVLKSDTKHPRIHVPSNESGKRRGFYRRVAAHIQKSVPAEKSSNSILHVNSAHLISGAIASRYPTIVQINDTEVCQSRFTLSQVRQFGWRRAIALQWRKRRERAVAANSEMVVCNSEFTTRTVREAYNLNSEKIQRVYKAVPLESFLRQEPDPLNADKLEIIFIGSNWRRKGLKTLIEAINQLSQTHPELPVALSVYGAPGSDELNHFRQFAITQGAEGKVQFAGTLKRTDAPKALSQSTMLVLPSFEEALGLVLIEALAAGLPVIGSNVGGIPEIINDDRLGRLVEVGNPTALADAIFYQYHMGSDHQIVDFRKQSSQRFSTDCLKKNIESLYHRCFEQTE